TSLAVSALRIMRYCPKNDRQFFFTVKERFHHGLIIYDILILIGKKKVKIIDSIVYKGRSQQRHERWSAQIHCDWRAKEQWAKSCALSGRGR
ncbi:MAG: hypothetical protein ACLTC5_01135, partial [Subdoligranulum sp.]